MTLKRSFLLINGTEIPSVGLGTFQGGPEANNHLVTDVVLKALALGYRHFDTAFQYGTEKYIGDAIKRSGVPREEMFLTSKLWNTWHRPGDVAEALDRTLECLGVAYVDLYLMHFPHAYQVDSNHDALRHSDGSGRPVIDTELSKNYPEVWHAMEKLVDSGKARAIGLANFNISKTKRILSTCRIRPAVNQIELHPLLPQYELVEFLQGEGILPVAHQPLGGPLVNAVQDGRDTLPTVPLLQQPNIVDVAQQCSVTPAQVCLSWLLQRGVAVVPKTIRQSRLVENLNFPELPKDCFDAVSDLHRETGQVRFLSITEKVGFDIFDEETDQPV